VVHCGAYLSFCKQRMKMNNYATSVEQEGLGFEDLWKSVIEEQEDTVLDVQGEIPNYITGQLIRNGPGQFESLCDDRKYTHVFDGLAKLHSFDINAKNGQVSFKSRFLRSTWYDRIVTKNGTIPPSITTGQVIEPEFSIFEKIRAALTSAFQFDNVPVNVHKLGGSKGKYVATTDAPVMIEFEKNLSTIGRKKYSDRITRWSGIELFSTAHPMSRGDISYNYFFELNMLGNNRILFVEINANGERKTIGSYDIKSSLVPYVHSFSLTENYAIITLWPLFMDPTTTAECKGFMKQLQWHGNTTNTKILVFDLNANGDGGEISSVPAQPLYTYDASPLFAYHHINAYECTKDQKTSIVFDVTGYDSPDIISGQHAFAYIPNMYDIEKRVKQARDGQTYRFEIPIGPDIDSHATPFIIPTVLHARDNTGQRQTGELLTINEMYRSTYYRYAYGFTGFAGKANYESWAIVKFDQEKGAKFAENEDKDKDEINGSQISSVSLWREASTYPSEAAFVSDPKSNEEDAGSLLTIVYDGKLKESFLLCLNAKDMSEQFRAYTKNRIPITFHGQYYAH
jgi:carotenoid cleavage dioxygenase-like enzyme